VISILASLFYNILLMSIGAILYNTNFGGIQFTPFAFIYFNAILSSHISFLFLFLLVFVLLVEGKGPRCSDGEFDSCAIHTHVTLLREGGYAEAQERDHACHVRGNRVSGTEKGEIAGGRSADGDIT
jgi:hypothetical protein